MNALPTLPDFIAFIRHEVAIPSRLPVSAATLLEGDLGITGDDGDDLLAAIEKHYTVSFIGPDETMRDVFDLDQRQYLFHSEGVGLFSRIAAFFGRDVENVKPLSIGQLYEATCRALSRAQVEGAGRP